VVLEGRTHAPAGSPEPITAAVPEWLAGLLRGRRLHGRPQIPIIRQQRSHKARNLRLDKFAVSRPDLPCEPQAEREAVRNLRLDAPSDIDLALVSQA